MIRMGRANVQPEATASSGELLSTTSRRRRIVEAVAFTAAWVAAGYLLRIGSNGYLLLGIPLTLGFQVLVRRRPVRELFAANPTRFQLDRYGWFIAAALAVVPGYYAFGALRAGGTTLLGWYLAAMAGAIFAAFALRAGTIRAALRTALVPIAVGASAFAAMYGVLHLVTESPWASGVTMLATSAKYTALYFPATFVLEEVAFRGVLDAHIHHHGETRGWQSAILVSTLWGLWHLPVSTGLSLPLHLVQLIAVHVLLGVPLSFAWRRTRNLAGPALAHAVNDAIRNAVMLGL